MNEQTTTQNATAGVCLEDAVMSAWWSPNLQKFLKKKRVMTRIYRDTETGIWWIGCTDSKFYAGAKFLGVLCFGTKADSWAIPESMADRWEDRTEQFWKCAKYFGRRMFRKWYWD